MTQPAVEWLLENVHIIPKFELSVEDILEQAKQMEKAQRIKDYNAGYVDAQINHVNDAVNYVYEIRYLQSKIEMIDDIIKAKEEKIANILINNVPDPEVKGYTIGPFGTPEKL
jgi:predicted phosphatase